MNVEEYYAALPRERRERLKTIRRCFVSAVDGVSETLRYKMPAFEKNENWVSLANQKHYISIYFCDEALTAEIRRKHPELNIGKGCVRVRDTQELPMEALKRAFMKAME